MVLESLVFALRLLGAPYGCSHQEVIQVCLCEVLQVDGGGAVMPPSDSRPRDLEHPADQQLLQAAP